MKLRIERARTDNGYGEGWVVLDHHGEVVWSGTHTDCVTGTDILTTLWSAVS